MIPSYSKDPNALIEIPSASKLHEVKKEHQDKGVILLFWADWHEPCNVLKNNMEELSKTHHHVKLAFVSLSITVQCNGDTTHDLVDTFKVE